MSYNYCWNQPKRFDQYDLYLDGKIKANDFIYRTKDAESGKISSTSLTEKIDSIESKLQSNFTFKHVAELPTNGEKNVIYLIPNTETSDDENEYKEYMWDDVNNKFELIGSGAYVQQKSELEDAVKALQDEIDADVKVETDRAIEKENELDGKIDSTKTDLQKQIDDRIVINEPISISKTEGDVTTTTTIDDKAISTTTLTGTLDAESMKSSLTAEAVQAVLPIAFSVGDSGAHVDANNDGGIAIGKAAHSIGNQSIAIGKDSYGHSYGVGIGHNAKANNNGAIAIGHGTWHGGRYGIAIGEQANGGWPYTRIYAIAMGALTKCEADNAITIGAQFQETVNGENVTNYCTTQGTGSITIGAGANTKNPLNPDNKTSYKNSDGEEVESSYSITIGQKAENHSPQNVVIGANAKASNSTKTVDGVEETVLSSNSVTIGYSANNTGSDSVVIGAQASGTAGGSLAMGVYAKAEGSDCTAVGVGAEAKNAQAVAVGKGSKVSGSSATAVGARSSAKGMQALALGLGSSASGVRSVAIGSQSTSADTGAVVFRSSASDDIYTQLYFSGQNTPLALKYYPTEWEKKQDVDDQGNPKVDENGEPVMVDDKDKPTKGQAMMGYVVSKIITNEEGKKETKVLECGTNLLAALFPNHGLGDNPFQPTTTAIDGEIVSFHPSDLDMPIEDTNVNVEEEYKPLPLSPIYPIVEPEIEEL